MMRKAKGKNLDMIGNLYNVRRPIYFRIPIIKYPIKYSDRKYRKILTNHAKCIKGRFDF